jgi:hypothetical protein
MLSVKQIVAMASAGVKVDLNDVKDLIYDEGTPEFSHPAPPIQPYLGLLGEFDLTIELARRMRWLRSDFHYSGAQPLPAGIDFIKSHRLNADTVVTIVVTGGKVLTIEDPSAIFPSDTLVTQIRLLEGNPTG